MRRKLKTKFTFTFVILSSVIPCHISKFYLYLCTILGSSQRCLLLHKSFDTIDHILDELSLRLSESSSVGNIEDTIVSLGMLTVNTSDLDLVFIGNLVESGFISHQLWKLDVDRSSHGSTKVSWARGNVTKMIVMGELADSFNMRGGSAESLEDLTDVSSWLHRDDSQLILLVDPDEESLVVVVENTSSRWPVSVETTRFKESVSLPI